MKAFTQPASSRFAALILIAITANQSAGQETESAIEAFIEPYKTIQIPATEIGTLVSIDVQEGDQVRRGQTLAQVDDRILQASLAAARVARDAKGNLRAAQAERDVKRRQLASLEELRTRGNATQREIDRALADFEASEARLLAVNEDLEIRRFEYDRILAQLEKRVLQSPIDGVVASINKDVGEFVAPTDPIVMTIVQLNIMQSVFSLPISVADKIVPGKTIRLTVGIDDQPVQGVIESVAPTADAKSGTVRVKIRIDNPNGRVFSGSTCRWELDANLREAVARVPSRKMFMAEAGRQAKGR
ncbi:Multidrug resistance protein MdtA precursor [Rosistilla carotiformis]|uniref:Multidrug resistance protein MdtA n=1 Tax=Rosistilla carotiformis TaxID=2528017 RepID=A0A518K036_9BACT|nr:efflux RND transporter periplasmic adaptor subunit [Rosistilla carotiformis]QDV71159.1 Multidrug resistance protein MdtA precursor [Rosistilla carotiformis]